LIQKTAGKLGRIPVKPLSDPFPW
jgi:hypothetical protein